VRAIVVDDAKAIRSIIGRFLVQEGFEVVEAANGKLALEKLKEAGALDLALVDWNMPEMNGIELVRALRADRGFDSMRVMMVTTESERQQVETALEAGADEYVMKPFTTDVLREKLALMGFGL
jgi:two-component system chemotaxis response regulator CheY